ncbi:EAL domain-containing protein, partial [Gilvimarinus sp. SDUM040013]|uniref:EAL domain-containing protein n=1 Tax=Gilvimarinus gilvus TaxID=3058038 RepID=UPI002672E1C8
MQEFSEWKKAGLMPGKLSMNLSMLQLEKDDFIDFVIRSAAACELSTSDLIFEVTETQAMLNPERSIIALNALKSLGPDIAIDDFGTGFSSLSYLKR